MSGGWITSAALAAIVVATAIFYWQRTVEHGFQLRKEKRELFRALSRSMASARTKLLDEGYYNSREYLDLIEAIYELDILGCRDVCNRANNYSQLLSSLHRELDPSDPDFDKNYLNALGRIGRLHAHVVVAMQIDLEFTPLNVWSTAQRAKKLAELDDFHRQSEPRAQNADTPE